MKASFTVGAVYLALQMVWVTPVLSAAPQSTSTQNKNTQSTSSQRKAQAPNAATQTAKQMTQLATRLLQHVDQARHAISSNMKQAAINHINQALADQNQLASLAKAKGLPMIVPLYSEFDESSTLAPLMAARKGGGSQQQPNKPAPAKSLTPVTVDQASAEYTSVGLDLDRAKSHLQAAKTALNNGNTQAAADSLSAVETDVVMETETANFPLLAARENLGIADTAVKGGHIKEATAALKEASTDLNTFAGGNPPQHADEARQLSKTLDAYSQSIGQNHTGAAAKIDGWWHEVDSWFQQATQSKG